jgi:hypothetical protein
VIISKLHFKRQQALSSAMTSASPPLPPGWTEHTAPTGHKYYYHAATKKSTYKRPVPEAPHETPPIAPEPTAPEEKPSTREPTPKDEEIVIEISEWKEDQGSEREESPERQTARMMGENNWKKLQDRPRKKYSLCELAYVELKYPAQSLGFK